MSEQPPVDNIKQRLDTLARLLEAIAEELSRLGALLPPYDCPAEPEYSSEVLAGRSWWQLRVSVRKRVFGKIKDHFRPVSRNRTLAVTQAAGKVADRLFPALSRETWNGSPPTSDQTADWHARADAFDAAAYDWTTVKLGPQGQKMLDAMLAGLRNLAEARP